MEIKDNRVFVVTFSDNISYAIPFVKVAELRADYYATEKDGHPKGSPEYNDEVHAGLSIDGECEDWLQNNTNWEDVCEFAYVHTTKPKEANYHDEWADSLENIEIEGDYPY